MTDIKETKEQKEARLAANHDLSVAFIRHLRDFLGLKHCYITDESVRFNRIHGMPGDYGPSIEEVPLDTEPFASSLGYGFGKNFDFTSMDIETWRRYRSFEEDAEAFVPNLSLVLYGSRDKRRVMLYGQVEHDVHFEIENGNIGFPVWNDDVLTELDKKLKKEAILFAESYRNRKPDTPYETTKKALLALDGSLFLPDIAERLDNLIKGNDPCPGETMKAIRDAILEKET
jgi:hypothetical protein